MDAENAIGGFMLLIASLVVPATPSRLPSPQFQSAAPESPSWRSGRLRRILRIDLKKRRRSHC